MAPMVREDEPIHFLYVSIETKYVKTTTKVRINSIAKPFQGAIVAACATAADKLLW